MTTDSLDSAGAMPHWSDPDPVRGAVLRDLLTGAGGDVLIVGPHDPALIDAVAGREVTVLVRGAPDARALADRYADRPGVRIRCGSLDAVATGAAYDTVVALDGVDRTGSTESADLSWSAAVARLLAVLRPGGRLLLTVRNPLGVDRLHTAATPDDADWAAPDDPTRPAGPEPLRAHLRDAGLTVARDYAAYPGPREPTALLSETALTDPDLHGVLTAVLRRTGPPPGPLLADPRPLAADLLRHRLATALAPAWIVVATRPTALPPAEALPETPPEALPDTPAEALPDTPAEALPAAPAGTLSTALPDTLPEALFAGGRLRRTAHGWSWDPSGAPVAAGRCLHDALLAAARNADQPELRRLLTAWQAGPCATIGADEIVLSADGGLHPLPAPTRRPGGRTEVLQRLAAALHQEGVAHLWPFEGTTELLAALSGIDLAPFPEPPAVPETLRELRDAHDRLAQRLSEARAQLAWYEQRTATLHRDLARAHRIIAVLKGTTPGRAAKAVLDGARSGKRLARAAIRRLRP
ncbi:hypothetical protein [Actinoplanes utahensis]|uniref:Class I SAM-dependent methyltransferase n=1 Tax=Actinoplanes utahensis TaxID=1869 RepID=A0A0A6XGM6_ACTUT|nr:hypothetical protein [Actinoplanes utahensis]KHD79247.1 hypothetical protein MB27_01140 [Actinoplanes utahensis]GIF30328.1 hypothetical protein Aut01nite_33140 [Actinoplanes utahensis]